MMPIMSGLEVVRRVRALQTDRPPHLIMLTGRSEKSDIAAGLDAGADDYLGKPFDPGELRARVEVGRRMVELREQLATQVRGTARRPAPDQDPAGDPPDLHALQEDSRRPGLLEPSRGLCQQPLRG